MLILLTVIHVIVCAFLILVVLLQSGKAADIAGAFGGMGSQTTFGPRGAATALTKGTTVAAALFMVTSLTLAILQTREAARGGGGTGSVLERANLPAAPPPSSGGTVPGTAPKTAPTGTPMQVPVTVPGAKGTAQPLPIQPAPAQPAKK
jgi:preprotein translocase subunit SecG